MTREGSWCSELLSAVLYNKLTTAPPSLPFPSLLVASLLAPLFAHLRSRSTETFGLVTRATSPFDENKLRRAGVRVPSYSPSRTSRVAVQASYDDSLLDLPCYKGHNSGRNVVESPHHGRRSYHRHKGGASTEEISALSGAIENLSKMIEAQQVVGMQQQQQQQMFPAAMANYHVRTDGGGGLIPETSISKMSTPGPAYHTPMVMSHQGHHSSQFRLATYQTMKPEVFAEREKIAQQKLEAYVTDMQLHEIMLKEKFFGKGAAGAGAEADKGEREVKEEGGKRILSEDIQAMADVLERYDDRRAAEELGKLEKKTMVDAGVATYGAGGDAEGGDGDGDGASFFKAAAAEEISKDTFLDIDVDEGLVSRISRYRAEFNRHREVSEAALLNSGYSQWQVVEIIADDIVDTIVKNVCDEVEKMMQRNAEAILRQV